MDPFYFALLLYLGALVLAFVDLFVPSGGVLLILAAATAVACILFGFRSSYGMGLAMLTIVFASVPAFAFAAIQIWPRTPIGRRIILNAPQQQTQAEVKESNHTQGLDRFVGCVIEAEYPMIPSGQIRIEGTLYNATSKSGVIESGDRVEILEIRDRNLVVEKTQKPSTTSTNRTAVTDTGAASEGHPEKASKGEPGDLAENAESNFLDLPAEDLGLDSID